MATNITYKCPECGAEIFWNAKKNCWKCDYCDSEYTLEQLQESGQGEEVDEENVQHHEEVDKDEYSKSNDGTVGDDLVKYTCSHCGSEIITNRTTAATVCVYCGNSVIMGEQVIDDFEPDYIIPFRIEKKAVMEQFREFSKKPLTPKDFDCDKIVDKMQGVYIPFWLYSGTCHGEIDGEGINVRSWRSGDYQYTERKHYHVYRDGTLGFKNIPVDGSKQTENDAMDSIEPFDYSEMVPFNTGYLSGYLAERFDEDDHVCYKRAEERISNTTRDELKKTCHYTTTTIDHYNRELKVNKARYALFPTWLLYTTYKDEKYFFAMNGQTGKFIGNLPIDKLKLTIYTTLGAIGGFVLGFILSFFN